MTGRRIDWLVVALLAWWMVVPPNQHDWDSGYTFDALAPLSAWSARSSHDGDVACEQERRGIVLLADVHAVYHGASYTEVELYRSARCVPEAEALAAGAAPPKPPLGGAGGST